MSRFIYIRRFFSLLFITIPLAGIYSCGNESLRESEADIMLLRSQMPRYHDFISRDSLVLNSLGLKPLASQAHAYLDTLPPPDSLDLIRMTIIQPYGLPWIVIDVLRADFQMNISTRLSSKEWSPSKKSLGDQFSTENRRLKKLEFSRLLHTLRTFTFDDAANIKSRSTSSKEAYYYTLEAISRYKTAASRQWIIQRSGTQSPAFAHLLETMIRLQPPQIEFDNKKILDKEFIGHAN